jgi:hypothetical protein
MLSREIRDLAMRFSFSDSQVLAKSNMTRLSSLRSVECERKHLPYKLAILVFTIASLSCLVCQNGRGLEDLSICRVGVSNCQATNFVEVFCQIVL